MQSERPARVDEVEQLLLEFALGVALVVRLPLVVERLTQRAPLPGCLELRPLLSWAGPRRPRREARRERPNVCESQPAFLVQPAGSTGATGSSAPVSVWYALHLSCTVEFHAERGSESVTLAVSLIASRLRRAESIPHAGRTHDKLRVVGVASADG